MPRNRPVRFEQMAGLVQDRIESPSEAGVERYVGLKHLDPDSLKIRRWGEPSDVESAHLLFRPGDIIFCKRRVYQRKLAVADFHGICSADAMVLRARADVVLPEFLPFFMQSDAFMNRALEISAGSLSPRIKWRTLAEQEFTLPPMNEQRRIMKALQASYTYKDKLQNVQECLISTLDSVTLHAMDSHASTHSISEYCDVNPDILTNLQLSSDEIWNYADLSSVSFPLQINGMQSICLSKAPSRARRISTNGDILVSTVRPNLKGHAMVANMDSDIVVSTGFTVLRPRTGSYKSIIMGLILSPRFLQHCEGRVTGTSYPAINPKDISGFPVPDILTLEGKGYETIFESLLKKISELWTERQSDYQRFSQHLFGEIFPA